MLNSTSLYNVVFHIWHDGQFGTINGYRLGSLPCLQVGRSSVRIAAQQQLYPHCGLHIPKNCLQVPWEEINAAWGQVTLLTLTLAQRFNVTFTEYGTPP